jgi:hypothetical protein
MVLLLRHVKDCPRPLAETALLPFRLRRSLERAETFAIQHRVEQLGLLVGREVKDVMDAPSVFAGEKVDFKRFILRRVSTV